MEKEKPESPPWEAQRPPVRKGLLRRLLLWGGALGILGLVAYGLKPRPVEVELAALTYGPLTVHVMEEGKTRIRDRYIISAPIAGSMRRVPLKAGDEVKAGETLLTVIDPAPIPLLDERGKAQAEAQLAAAQASRTRAEQALANAKTAAEFAQSNWTRVQQMTSPGSISATDRENFQRDAEMKNRDVTSAEFALKVADFEIAQSRAALLQQTKSSPADLASIEIRSPVSGRLLKVQQESAATVTPGTLIAEVGDPANLEIEAEILSRDAVAIKPGAEVSVEQWGPGEPLKARVRLVEPAAFTKVSALGVEEQRVIVLSDLVNPSPSAKTLGDRYRVEVRVAIWHEDRVLLIPSGALFREGTDWKTFLFENNKARKVTVQAGRTDGRKTQVLEGLKEGDRVLLHPPDSVKDGIDVVEREVSGGAAH